MVNKLARNTCGVLKMYREKVTWVFIKNLYIWLMFKLTINIKLLFIHTFHRINKYQRLISINLQRKSFIKNY